MVLGVAPPATGTRAHCALRMGVAVERPAVVWTVEPGAKPSTRCAHTNDMSRLDVGRVNVAAPVDRLPVVAARARRA